MKLKICIFFFVSIFILSNCNTKEPSFSNNCKNLKNKKSIAINIEFIDWTIADTLPTYYKKVQIFKDKYLIGQTKQKYFLDVFKLNSKTFLKRIIIDKNLIPNISSFYVHNLDSIFITQEPYTISIINDKGRLINKFLLSKAPINWKLDGNSENIPLYYFDNDRGNINFFDAKNNLLHLTLTHTDIYYFDNRNTFKLNYTYNIKNKLWVKSFGEIDSLYSYFPKQKLAYLPFLSQPFCQVKGDSTYISYPISHMVSIYNNKTGDLIDKKCISSKFINELPHPFNINSDNQTQLNFIICSPYYGDLNYHEKIGLFSRIAVHEQKLKNRNGKLNKVSSKKCSVIFFDSNLNIKDEYVLDENSNFSSFGDPESLIKAYPNSEGFIGSLNQKLLKKDKLIHSILLKFAEK